MDVHAWLVEVVTGATSAADALDSAARVVAEALSADTCSLFVRTRDHQLDLRAHAGPVPEPAAWGDEAALAHKALDATRPMTSEASGSAILAVPIAAINQAIGAIVVRRPAGAAFTAEEIMRLSGVASQLVAVVESARLSDTLDRSGAATPLAEPEPEALLASTGERVLEGVAASPGIAIGTATFRSVFPRAILHQEKTYRGEEAENARVRDAYEKTRNDLVRLQSAAASEIGEEEALIFGTHLLLLHDPLLTGLVGRGIASGRTAAVAVSDGFDEIARRLRETHDPYIQERVEDVEDLRTRVLDYLVGAERHGELDARVVVGARTTPSLVVELKGRGALGIASELGGSTSHGVLLARALGVPAVTGVANLIGQVGAGDELVVDGDEGRVVLRPTAETKADYARRAEAIEKQRTEFLRYHDVPASTADGVRFQLQANIALGADIAIARANGADGIGLYRTEFPFIVRDALPTVEEQVRIYAKPYEAFPDAPITFRLLDLAGDKFLPSRELGVVHDAFHGYRSIRILFDYPHVLRDQVQAFALAAAGKPLRILIPLVTSVQDVVRIKQLVEAALAQLPPSCKRGPLLYGAMVETPAAVEMVSELAREVEFFSIGTNDLIQYSLVVDREDPRMATGRHAYHPAILRMLHRVVQRARAAGRHVAVCGEMAGRPLLAITLLAMGVDALSVTPRAIPELKQALAQTPLEPLRGSVEALVALPSTEAVETALRQYARDGKPVGEASPVA